MSIWINEYMACPYVAYARGPESYDCWGLVRQVLSDRFGVPVLASFGQIDPDDKAGMTQGFKEVVRAFELAAPQPGSVAACFHGEWLVHVGVCVEDAGALKVLHTSRRFGPSLDSVRVFQRLSSRVVFYRYGGDPGFPEQIGQVSA